MVRAHVNGLAVGAGKVRTYYVFQIYPTVPYFVASRLVTQYQTISDWILIS